MKLYLRYVVPLLCAMLLSACSAAPPGISLKSVSLTPEIVTYDDGLEAAPFAVSEKAYLNIISAQEESAKAVSEQVVEFRLADDYSMSAVFEDTEVSAQSDEAQMVIEAMGVSDIEPYSASFAVTYLSDELLSCIVTLDEGGENMLPITIRRDTGDRLVLSDFFIRSDQSWRALLAEIVTDAAQNEGMTLLCDVMPVDDARPFFILDGDIVLFYRTYEIATYESGLPCFILPMESLSSYLIGAYGVGVVEITELDASAKTEAVSEILIESE